MNLFHISFEQWLEVKIGDTWTLGCVHDISPDGHTVYVRTHIDYYPIKRTDNRLRLLEV